MGLGKFERSQAYMTRKPEEIEQTEYDSFYKSISKDSDPPLAHVHFKADRAMMDGGDKASMGAMPKYSYGFGGGGGG